MSGIILVGCFAQVCRNIISILFARDQDGEKKTGHAEVVIDYTGRLYGMEKFVRQQELSAQQIYDLRNHIWKEPCPFLWISSPGGRSR